MDLVNQTPEKVKAALKKVMKSKGHTYKDLSEQLECSLPTAKRVLGPEELTLSRLSKILEWLGISFKDLDKMIRTTETDFVNFNKEQDEFLAKNPMYMAYLLKLRGGDSPDQIAKKYQLNKRSTDKYLLRLEQLELIRVTGKGQIKIPTPIPKGFAPTSALAKCHFEKIVDNSSEYFKKYIERELYRHRDQKSDYENQRVNYSVKSQYLTKQTYEVYQKKLQAIFVEMTESATADEKIHSKNDLHSCVVVVGNSIGPYDDPIFESILNTFGDIQNL